MKEEENENQGWKALRGTDNGGKGFDCRFQQRKEHTELKLKYGKRLKQCHRTGGRG